MLLLHLGKLQKGLFIILLLVLALDIYYESGTIQNPTVVNPYADNRLTDEEKNWITFNNNQFKEDRTEIKLFEEGNFWGMSYYIRLKQHNYPNPIEEIKLYDPTSKAKGELTNAQYKEALLHVNVSILGTKQVTFTDNKGNTIIVRINPFDYVHNTNFQIPLMLFVVILTIALGLSLLPGAIILGLITCGLVALTGRYYYLAILIPLVFLSVNRIQMVTLSNSNKLFDYKNKILAVIIFIIVMAYYSLPLSNMFEKSMLSTNIITSIIYAGIGMYLSHLSINLIKVLSLFIKFPIQKVDNLTATNLITNLKANKPIRQFPKYYADIVIDNHYTFTKVDIDGALYGSLHLEKPFHPLKYRTDGKSFILYY